MNLDDLFIHSRDSCLIRRTLHELQITFRPIREDYVLDILYRDDIPRVIHANDFIEKVNSHKETLQKKAVSDIDITVADMIVTVLCQYDVEFLKAFLDPRHENVAFYRLGKNPFIIKKQGSKLRVGRIHKLDDS